MKWWSEYPAHLLQSRVVEPLQQYLTDELSTTKKLTVSVMNSIKVLAKVEEANQLGRQLPPEAFYNLLIRFPLPPPLLLIYPLPSHLTRSSFSSEFVDFLWRRPTSWASRFHQDLLQTHQGELPPPLPSSSRHTTLDVGGSPLGRHH